MNGRKRWDPDKDDYFIPLMMLCTFAVIVSACSAIVAITIHVLKIHGLLITIAL